MKLTEAMATLNYAGLMPVCFYCSSYWANDESTYISGRFLTCNIDISELHKPFIAGTLDSKGIRIVYFIGKFACFEFSEDIEVDVL